MRHAALLVVLFALAAPVLRAEEEVGRDYAPEFPEPIAFDPAEWETSDHPPSIADPRARKGGKVVLATSDWPPTLRTEGPNSRLTFLSDLHTTIYEPLLGLDAVSMRFVPGLATHWQVSEDKLTYRFRLDERARWADGREVTADDVVATVEHLVNPDREDPLVQEYWDEVIEYAKVVDKHTVEVKTREPRWRSLLLVGASMKVYPAAYVRMDGKTYLEEWDWKLPPGTGPYEIRPEDVRRGLSITLRRREDWWAKDLPENRGVANFDEIEWRVVRDKELMYQKLVAGKLDMYRVGRAKRWVHELDRETSIQQGWLQKRKVYNKVPCGFGGFCLNLRRAPFDDRNVRLAFAHLFNREKLFADTLDNEYEYTKSYFPDLPYERPNAERVRYDPEEARRLLAKSGWVKRDADGNLVNEGGERFPVLRMEFANSVFERIFAVPKEDLWNEAGIELQNECVDYASLLNKVWEYDYQLVFWSWTATLFPDPIHQFHSKHADPKRTNNLNGFQDEEADRLMEDYQQEWDPEARKRMLQRLDEILFDSHIYALHWYAPFWRIVYWDKFGHPPEYQAPSTREWINVMFYWWYDPQRWIRTLENRSLDRPNHPDDPDHQYDDVEPKWWRNHDRPMPR